MTARLGSCRSALRREQERAARARDRLEKRVQRAASRLALRQAAARDRLVAELAARLDRLVATLRPGRASRRRFALARRRVRERLAALDRRHAAQRRDLVRRLECAALGRLRTVRAVRAGCEDVCALGLPDGVGGDKAMVALPSARGTPRMLPARYVLTSASRLVASHDPLSFDPRPDYPDATQERRYEREPAEKLKVVDIAQNMQPGLVANTNAGAVDGTPIVTTEGIVLSGNGRTMGVQRHYRSGRRVLADYLARHAAQFGLDPAAVGRLADPIVVRVLEVSPGDRARLVRDFNVGLTQELAADVEAAALARQLPADVAALLREGRADESLATYLRGRASLPLVGALERSGFINRANRARVLDADGLLSAEARATVGRLLAAWVLPLALAERSPELARAIERSAPGWIAAAGAGPDWDLRGDMAAAAADFLALRGSGQCLATWLRQEGLTRHETEGRPTAALLLRILDLGASKPATLARVAASFAAKSRESGGLFGGADPRAALADAARDGGLDPGRADSRRRCRR